MRIIILLLVLSPAISFAQINRSANELAGERLKEYIESKLFKNYPYTAISSGTLKPYNNPMSAIAWTIEHRFLIASPVFADTKKVQTTAYRFSFYLDKKLKVLKAESYLVE
jgi:hypothetical protein